MNEITQFKATHLTGKYYFLDDDEKAKNDLLELKEELILEKEEIERKLKLSEEVYNKLN